MNTSVRGTSLEIVVDDILALSVDGIVTTAGVDLAMASGAGAAIKAAGGETIEREAMLQAPVRPGDAVPTTGGTLGARWVIHVALAGAPDAALVARATWRLLEVADRVGVRSLAVPWLGADPGSGDGGVPPYACASIVVTRTRDYLEHQRRTGLRRIVFCASDAVTRAALGNALAGSTRI